MCTNGVCRFLSAYNYFGHGALNNWYLTSTCIATTEHCMHSDLCNIVYGQCYSAQYAVVIIIQLTFAEWYSSGPYPIGLAGASIIPDQQVALDAAVGGCEA